MMHEGRRGAALERGDGTELLMESTRDADAKYASRVCIRCLRVGYRFRRRLRLTDRRRLRKRRNELEDGFLL
jgi:hypothetical protein